MTAVRILRLAAGGDGVGRLPDGRTVFVPRTAPGDLVELTAIREHKRFARATLARLVEPAAERVEPPCPHYVDDQCGGCQLQHLGVEAQRAARRGFVGDALRRLGQRDVADPEIVPAAQEFGYRTKLTLAASPDARRIGLHPLDRPDLVFELEQCPITTPELNRLWAGLRESRSLLPPRLDRIVLRLDREGARHLILRVRSGAAWNGARALAEALAQRGAAATVWWQPEGGAARVLASGGQPYPATVFEQVNPVMGDQVRDFAIEGLGPLDGRAVWDLYAGIGETTARLCAAGARVESVESDRRAVQEAERRGPAARRHVGLVEEVLGELGPPELVVTNPPRVGMHRRVTEALHRLGPRRIVYVSCDPATLARDLTRLPGYAIVGLRAFDLFPQTAHVETVAVLELVG